MTSATPMVEAETFDDLPEEQKVVIRKLAQQFGVPVSAAFNRAKGMGLLNTPAPSTPVAEGIEAVAWLIDDTMLTNIEEAAKEYAAAKHLVVGLVRRSEAASTIASLSAANEALCRERSLLIETKRDQLSALTIRADKAEAALATAQEALTKLSCPHVTEGPLWWQIEARQALASLNGDSTP